MKRLAVFFFFDQDGIADSYVDYFLADLAKNADRLMIVCNGILTAGSRTLLTKHTQELIVRENSGYDVWAYKTALEKIGWNTLAEYEELLLCNFTVFGPLYPFSEMFSAMEKRDLDFWGITKFNRVDYDPWGTICYNFIPEHLQSNFIVVRRSLFLSEAYRNFWENMTPVRNYAEAIGKYEAVFTKKFADLGFRWDTYVNTDDLVNVSTQPLVMCSRELVENRRCPIIKRRMFFQNYYDILSETDGSNCRETLEYIREHCEYDTDMIWENLLRTCNMADLKCSLNLNYILPSRFSAGPSKSRIALIFHLFFRDQIGYCRRFLANLPENTDFYIATPCAENKAEIEEACRGLTRGKLEVHVVPNRGRDLGTLLIEFKSIVPEYDYICFAHDKKAGQVKPQAIGLNFRDKCFENMLFSREYVENIVRTFDENPRLGMLMPPYPEHGAFFFTLKDAWSINYPETLKLAERLKLRCMPDRMKEPVAPLGSFFWFRADAYKTMLSYPWKYEDFPEEPIADDGTFLHALERIRPFAVQHDGFYSAWVLNDDYARVELNNVHFMLKETCCALNLNACNFQNFILAVWHLTGQLSRFSREWFKVQARRYMPPATHAFLKRLYQRTRRIARLRTGEE